MDSNTQPGTKRLSSRFLTGLGLLVPLILVSFFSWQAIRAAVTLPEASDFWRPLALFSALIILFGLEVVLVEHRLLRGFILFTVFLPSIFFARTPAHLVFIGAGILLSWRVFLLVDRELRERLKISITKALLSGLPVFLFALSIVISSQYYVHVQSLSWERLIPNFRLSERNTAQLFHFLGSVYAPLREVSQGDMTVGEFLSAVGPTVTLPSIVPDALPAPGMEALSPELTADMEQTLVQTQLEAKQKSLSDLVGRPVRSDEKINTVLSEILQEKLTNAAVSARASDTSPVPIIPLLLAFLLFLTVYPFATFLLSFWSFGSTVLFRLAQHLGLVAVDQITVEQERIRE